MRRLGKSVEATRARGAPKELWELSGRVLHGLATNHSEDCTLMRYCSLRVPDRFAARRGWPFLAAVRRLAGVASAVAATVSFIAAIGPGFAMATGDDHSIQRWVQPLPLPEPDAEIAASASEEAGAIAAEAALVHRTMRGGRPRGCARRTARRRCRSS